MRSIRLPHAPATQRSAVHGCVGRLVLSAAAALAPLASQAGGGPFGIDHQIAYDDSGIWKRSHQLLLERGAAVVVLADALWEGDRTRLGHADWQAVDSMLIGAAASQGLKYAFSRARPSQTGDPNDWFKGKGHQSFPSGEVTWITSAVTPYVLTYGADQPAVYALELLPLYDAVARVKVRAHWQSDVLAGFALGTAVGYYAQHRGDALTVNLLPRGVAVGWKARF